VSTGTPVGPAQPTATEAPDEDRRRAIDAVGRRMLSAALREGLVTEPPAVPAAEPAEILRHLGLDAPHLREELDDAVGNLALAYRRRRGIDAIWRSIAADGGSRDAYGVVAQLAPDAQMIALERLATEGHNLHPCGRTRLGWPPSGRSWSCMSNRDGCCARSIRRPPSESPRRSSPTGGGG